MCTAAVGMAAVVFVRDPALSSPFAKAALTFGAITILTQLLNYRKTSGTTGSLSFIPVLASAAIAPHWITVVVIAVTTCAEQLLSGRPPIKVVFNTAQQSFSTALAILAYGACGGIPLTDIADSSSLSLFALFLVFFVTNSVCVSGALGIATERDAWAIWKEMTLKALPYDFLSLP
jgi:hypothetical protein